MDDDELILKSTGRLLKSWGYGLIHATDGAEAVTLYEKHRSEISCVLLDMVMPTLNGKETLRILLTIDPSAQVILTSSQLDEAAVTDLLPAVVGFVAKPHDQADLRRLLERACSRG